MKITKLELAKLPDNLLRALDDSERRIQVGGPGYFSHSQMHEAIAKTESLPYGTKIAVREFLDADKKPAKPPVPVRIVTNRTLAEMSGCGLKQFLGHTRTRFSHFERDEMTVICATLANLWMVDAAFHGHSIHKDGSPILNPDDLTAQSDRNETTINPKQQRTFEDYFVAGGGNAWYVMGTDIYYVEPKVEPEAGPVWFPIPPGYLHGVFSEDPNDPALALLNFQNEGLCLRTETQDKSGWGWPRNETAFTFTSRAIRSMVQIAHRQEPEIKLPPVFTHKLKTELGLVS